MSRCFWAAFLSVHAMAAANAASLQLVPTTPTQNVANGDIVSFDIMMDFTGEPTIGGGFNLYFDAGALGFVSFFRDESVGDPNFSRDPDIFLDGLLDGWATGDVGGLPAVAVLGNVVFEVLPGMGLETTIDLRQDSSICGCWISTDFVSIVDVDYGQAIVSRVPLPAAAWSLAGGIGILLGFARARDGRN